MSLSDLVEIRAYSGEAVDDQEVIERVESPAEETSCDGGFLVGWCFRGSWRGHSDDCSERCGMFNMVARTWRDYLQALRDFRIPRGNRSFIQRTFRRRTFWNTMHHALEQRGSELHVSAIAFGQDPGGMARGDYRRVCICMQSAHAADAHHENERCRHLHGSVPESSGALTGCAAAGSGSLSVCAHL